MSLGRSTSHLTLLLDTQQAKKNIWRLEIASIGLEEDRLSKVFLAGLRTQPDKEDSNMTLKVEQETLGIAMASLAALGRDTLISDKH